GLNLNPASSLQRLSNVIPLYLFDVCFEVKAGCWKPVPRGRHCGLRTGTIAADRRRQAFGQNRGGRLEGDGPFDDVFELTNVARPIMLDEQLHGATRDAGDGLAHRLGVLAEEMLREQRDVFAA